MNVIEIPVHGKVGKQVLKNYRPVSLLPFCGKIFEKLIFNPLMPGGNKKVTHTYTCLSICDLFVTTRH